MFRCIFDVTVSEHIVCPSRLSSSACNGKNNGSERKGEARQKNKVENKKPNEINRLQFSMSCTRMLEIWWRQPQKKTENYFEVN